MNDRVDPALFGRSSVTIANRLPKSDDACGLVKYGRTTNNDDTQYVGKIDYQRTDKDSIFGRVLDTAFSRPIPLVSRQTMF